MPKKSTSTKPKSTSSQEVQPHADDHQHHEHDHHHHQAGPRHPEMGDNKEFTFTIPWADIKTQYDKLVVKYQPHVKTQGFRKGKAPAKMVEQIVGTQRLYQEAIEKLLPDAYFAAIKANNLQPISDPEIHPHGAEPDKDWEFHAIVAEKPEIKLGKYQAIVKKAAQDFMKSEAKQDKKKDKVSTTDEDKSAKTDQAAVEKDIKDRKLTALLGALRDELKPIIPELLVKQDAQRQIDSLVRQLQMANIPADGYLKSLGKTEADLQSEYVGRALANWQIEVILDAISTDQKIEITDADVEAEIKTSIHKPESYSQQQRAYIKSALKKQKVFDYLLSLE